MSRRMRWAGQVTQMGEKRNAYRILMESQKARDHLEDEDVKLNYLEMTVLRCGVGEVWVVVGRAPAC
jgi:hypothetical protein